MSPSPSLSMNALVFLFSLNLLFYLAQKTVMESRSGQMDLFMADALIQRWSNFHISHMGKLLHCVAYSIRLVLCKNKQTNTKKAIIWFEKWMGGTGATPKSEDTIYNRKSYFFGITFLIRKRKKKPNIERISSWNGRLQEQINYVQRGAQWKCEWQLNNVPNSEAKK